MTPTDKQAAVEAALDEFDLACVEVADPAAGLNEANRWRKARASLLALLAEPRPEGAHDWRSNSITQEYQCAHCGQFLIGADDKCAAAPSPTELPVPAVQITTIPIDEYNELRKSDGPWQLFHTNGDFVRSLNGFESEFVDCAIRSAALQTAARLAAAPSPTPSNDEPKWSQMASAGFRCEGIDPMQTFVDDPTLPRTK